jgi:hypothetical protein
MALSFRLFAFALSAGVDFRPDPSGRRADCAFWTPRKPTLPGLERKRACLGRSPEKTRAGAEARALFCGTYGTTEVVL